MHSPKRWAEPVLVYVPPSSFFPSFETFVMFCSFQREDGGEVSSLVAKHVKQLELMEQRWGNKVKLLKKEQKKTYANAILRWANEGIPTNVLSDITTEQQPKGMCKFGNLCVYIIY